MEFDKTTKIPVNEHKLNKLLLRVYNLEHNNFTSKKLKDNQIVDSIIKMIDTEVQNDN